MGRKHPLHVEYIHIGACLGYIQDVVFEAILAHPRLKLEQKMKIVKALGKVLWIQNDLFAKWYVRDGDEFREGTEEEPAIEPEGFLHGKRMVEEEEEEEAAEGTENGAAAGGCPFAGAAGATRIPHLREGVVPHVKESMVKTQVK
jgi:hypothetical protein